MKLSFFIIIFTETVHCTGKTRKVGNVTYTEIVRTNGDTGWANKPYIAENSTPAIITDGKYEIFRQDQSPATVYQKEIVDRYQVIAIKNRTDEGSGWPCISFVDTNTNTLYSDVYMPGAHFAEGNNLTAAVLLQKLKLVNEEKFKKEETKTKYQTMYRSLIDQYNNNFIDKKVYHPELAETAREEQEISSPEPAAAEQQTEETRPDVTGEETE